MAASLVLAFAVLPALVPQIGGSGRDGAVHAGGNR